MIFSIDTYGEALALYDASAGRWIRYAELAVAVRELADKLRSNERSLIFNFCRNDFRSVCTYLAALEAGFPVALLDDKLAPDLRERLLEIYRPEWISDGSVSDGEFLRRAEGSGEALHPKLAVLLSTSGSTGSPKLVRLTRENVESNAASISEALAIRAEDRAIQSLPIHYSYGLSVLNTHLVRGASNCLTDESLTSGSFWNLIREQQCTSFAGVPYSYQILQRLRLEGLNAPSLHTLTQAGGKLHVDLIAKFSELMRARGGRFYVMYGQTEATARISILPSSALPEKLGSVGVPVPGGKVEIESDGELTTVAGRAGELVYSGPNVMMGYAESRADLGLGDQLGGILRTGDMAYLDADGFIHITGRAKRDVKLFGLRVNLDEIENLMRVRGPAAAVSKNEGVRVYCEYGDAEVLEECRRELAQKLGINYRAFEFERIDKLPTTANGKIDYQSLASRP